MKIRNGFVSNSSTSSFICEICHEIESGMDLGLEEVEMFECKNGHTVHHDCAKIKDEDREELEKFIEENEPYEVDPKFCPLCTLEEFSNEDVLEYLLKAKGISKEEVLNEIKEKYSSFKEFKKYLKEK